MGFQYDFDFEFRQIFMLAKKDEKYSVDDEGQCAKFINLYFRTYGHQPVCKFTTDITKRELRKQLRIKKSFEKA